MKRLIKQRTIQAMILNLSNHNNHGKCFIRKTPTNNITTNEIISNEEVLMYIIAVDGPS